MFFAGCFEVCWLLAGGLFVIAGYERGEVVSILALRPCLYMPLAQPCYSAVFHEACPSLPWACESTGYIQNVPKDSGVLYIIQGGRAA